MPGESVKEGQWYTEGLQCSQTHTAHFSCFTFFHALFLFCVTLAPTTHLFFFRQKKKKKLLSLFARSFTLWEQQTGLHSRSLENYSSPASFHHDPRLSLLGSLSLLTRWNETQSPEEAVPVIRLKWAKKNGGDYLILDRLNYLDWECKRGGDASLAPRAKRNIVWGREGKKGRVLDRIIFLQHCHLCQWGPAWY